MRLEFITLSVILFGSVHAYVIDDDEEFIVGRKELSQEEEMLADQARADIAEAIENNLVKMFATIIIAQKNDEISPPYPRQDEDGDGDFEIVTPNPNVLPQVAQILGAIFSGTLNITRIADGTVGLVPNFLRNQIQGLVKLLTGETINLSSLISTTTTPLPAPTKVETTTVDVIFEGDAPSTVSPPATPLVVVTDGKVTKIPVTTIPPKKAASSVPAPVAPVKPSSPPKKQAVSAETPSESGMNNVNLANNKMRYRVKNKTKRTTTIPPQKPTPVDDELERVERDLVDAAWALEPYEHREPRFYAELFNAIMKNVNMTQMTKAVPSIFKGATQAIVMLENLGVVDSLPGANVLGDLEDVVDRVTDIVD